MMISRGRLSFPRFQKDKFLKTLDEEVRTQMRQAARAWLRAVIPKVPVYTGTARGSLIPIGRLLQVAVPISPVAFRKNRGPGVGARLSPQTMPAYFPAPQNNLYKFEFTTDVAHFIANNLNPAHNPPFNLIQPTPWYATEAGNLAFNAYMATELPKRLKRFKAKDFISFHSISYGSG